MTTTPRPFDVRALAHAAKRAGRLLVAAGPASRSRVIAALAHALDDAAVQTTLMAANATDLARAQTMVADGSLDASAFARLKLTTDKLRTLRDGMRQLADTPDPVGVVQLRRELDTGLFLRRETCPLGVLGVVFEARPDALPQIVSLAFRTGNAVLLKGGTEAHHTNEALLGVVHDCLAQEGLPRDTVASLASREDVAALLTCKGAVDLIIARGGRTFVETVQRTSTIAVLGHAEGMCHIYLDASADASMSAAVVTDAKCSYPAACNAIETLLWHPQAAHALRTTLDALAAKGVALLGCTRTRAQHPHVAPASEADWDTEYGDLKLSIRCVDNLADALAHIEQHGSGHTEAIVSQDPLAQSRFQQEVDAGCVFVNASTRFADGFRFGMGAEVGVSTSKLHARGPAGIDSLLTYRWLLEGQGHITLPYDRGERTFLHREL